ncbi:MAG: hypothetical protein GXO87_09985 [Chlorobi bacterium]|nr:hypothetical protein [Chlorobiota bacterium]
MKKITDETLNDYIDGRLSIKKLNEIENALKNDEELLERLRALQTVNKELRLLKTESAPFGITEKIMNKISARTKSKQRSFFVASVSAMGLLLAAALGILIYFGQNKGSDKVIFGEIFSFIKKRVPINFSFVKNFTISNDAIIAIAGFSLLLLIFFYFLLDSHKMFKDELNRFTT